MLMTNRKSRAWGLAAEFILIVVGVTVALSADQWVQGRTEQARLSEYLSQLQSALVEDSSFLAGRLSVVDFRLEAALTLDQLAGDRLSEDAGCSQLPRLSDNRLTCDETLEVPAAATILVAAQAAAAPILFYLNTDPFEDLRSSGLVHLLQAEDRNAISSYYRRAEDAEDYWSGIESDLDQVVLATIPVGWVLQENSDFRFNMDADPTSVAEVANQLLLSGQLHGEVRRQRRRLGSQRAGILLMQADLVEALATVRSIRAGL